MMLGGTDHARDAVCADPLRSTHLLKYPRMKERVTQQSGLAGVLAGWGGC